MLDLYSNEVVNIHGTDIPVFNVLYMSNKGVISAKRVAAYHSDLERNLIYGHQLTIATEHSKTFDDLWALADDMPVFVSLRTDRVIDVFSTPGEAIAACRIAETLYADKIQEIKSHPSYKGPMLDRAAKDYSFKVCFTGFNKEDKAELVALAESAGMKTATSVSASLDFLCCGKNAGWAKMKKANELAVPLMRSDQFKLLLETGELPESLSETM